MKLFLASRSPRRIEMLTALGADLTIVPADIDEEAFPAPSPAELVRILAREKALAALLPEGVRAPVVAADTVVDLDGRVLGKPKDDADAAAMLRALSGRSHLVHTGIAVRLGERLEACTVSTEVVFRKISEEEIDAYVRTGEPRDKAGSYGIQGRGGLFVREIRGDYFSVVGLPVCRLNEMLKEIGTSGLLH